MRAAANGNQHTAKEFHDGQFKVRELLHSFVSFKRQNLLEMPPIAPTYDIIFCRNVLIYFEGRGEGKSD